MTEASAEKIEGFIARWSASSGAERANFQGFAYELCDLIGVARPSPSVHEADRNPYAFERAITFREAGGATSPGRIDLYKRGSFVLEAKQSREKGGAKELILPGQGEFFVADARPRGQRKATRAWDVLMMRAREQAEQYARALPASDGWPPFILVCDVGHCIEVYADFTGQGKHYAQFPDRNRYRVYLEELRDPEVRDRLRRIWDAPISLDPARHSARVTREIAIRLAKVSVALEKRKVPAEDVALFLMRCLFTMFAEDVKLLPQDCFKDWLARSRENADKFKHELADLWAAMDKGGYATIAGEKVRRFNGSFFKSAQVLDLKREQIGELLAAAKYDWKEVDPAIFGTLLEQALTEKERSKLGAHYTPRDYVKHLVIATVMEPLRRDWNGVTATADRLHQEKKDKEALQVIRDFHHKLCATRVLDPACGTGNFLYVALELLKDLENEVLEAAAGLGGQEGFSWMDKETVGPKQFLGLELNPRAREIAELVVWLGYLQLHYKSKPGHPPEPILDDLDNIKYQDAVLTWDGYPLTTVVCQDGDRWETLPNPRRPPWPEAEFIVGNPPFIGKGEPMRNALGQTYLDALWRAHPQMNESSDFVMYWWDRAAEIVAAQGSPTQRFGLVTTNSITQVFNRRVLARHLSGGKHGNGGGTGNGRKNGNGNGGNGHENGNGNGHGGTGISLVMAIPDHPWTKATRDHASVRIAMTVGERAWRGGILREVASEAKLDTDEPEIAFTDKPGRVNADLTVGVDVTAAVCLRANRGVASMGPALGGRGFVLTAAEADFLAGGRDNVSWLKRLTTGKDITNLHRDRYVIDVRKYETESELRRSLPKVYQHLKATVYPERRSNNDAKLRNYWWRYRRSNEIYFEAIAGLDRFIATVETAKHRIFMFLQSRELIEHGVIGFGFDDAFDLGILSSKPHVCWSLGCGGTLEDRPRYNKDVCFDPFPFPDCSEPLKQRIRDTVEDLEKFRKVRLAESPGLTLTEMYNLLGKLDARPTSIEPKKGRAKRRKSPPEVIAIVNPNSISAPANTENVWTTDDDRIFNQGLVLILKELHDQLDALVFEAYGWPTDLSDEEILEHLVALNKARAAEEKAGTVRWLRPDYQIERFGSEAEKARLAEAKRQARERLITHQGALALEDDLREMKPRFPTGKELEETAAIMRMLASAKAPLAISGIAAAFSQGKAVEKRVALTILALARLGHVGSADEGATFSLRRQG